MNFAWGRFNIVLLAFVSLAFTNLAKADYYSGDYPQYGGDVPQYGGEAPQYGGYDAGYGGGGGGYGGAYGGGGGYAGSYGGSGRQAIISLELNEKESLNSSLRVAARENRLEDLKRIVQRGGDVNSQSSAGDTALMYAARNCSSRIVQYLLTLKINVNLRNKLGRTAMMNAASGSCAPVVRQLLTVRSINLNIKDRYGRTLRDYALNGAELEVGGPVSDTYSLIKAAQRHQLRRGKQSAMR